MYKIEELELYKKTNEKTPHIFNVSGDSWILLNLKKGCEAGSHYHEGKSKLKDPETMIIIKGKVQFFLRDIKTNEEKEFVVEAPKIVKINKNIWHKILALEDLTFIEPTSKEAIDDIVKVEF